jgi:hypothetical protein
VRRAEVDAGEAPGVTTTAAAREIRELKRKNAELEQTVEILKAAANSTGQGNSVVSVCDQRMIVRISSGRGVSVLRAQASVAAARARALPARS